MSETTAVVKEEPLTVDMDGSDGSTDETKKNGGRKSARLTAQITAFISLAVSVLFLVFMLCGAYQHYRHDVNLIYAVTLIINLFDINKSAVYRPLIGVVISIMYFASVGLMIKWLVQSVGRCIYVVRSKDGESSLLSAMDGNLFRNAKMYCVICGNILISSLVSPAEINGTAIVIMILFVIMYVAHGLIGGLFATPRREIKLIVTKSVKDALLAVTICAVIVWLNNAAIMDLIYGMQALFNENVFSGGAASFFYSIYVFIIEPALWCALAFLSFSLVYEFAIRAYYFGTRKRVIVVMIIAGVALGLHLIFKVILVNASSSFHAYMIGEWLQAVSKTYLPLLLLYVATFVILMFYKSPKAC